MIRQKLFLNPFLTSAGANELNQATLICASWYSGTLFTVEYY